MRVTFHVETQEDGRKRAVDVRDRHGRPVDDSLLRRQKAAARYAATDRVPTPHGCDTFVGRKPTNEDRATSFGGDGDAEGFDLDLGKWFGVYDGHGGQEAAEYVMSKLHTHSLVSRVSQRESHRDPPPPTKGSTRIVWGQDAWRERKIFD